MYARPCLLALLALPVLALGACGGGEDRGSAGAGASTPSSATPSTSTPSTSTPSTSTPTTSTPTGTGTGGAVAPASGSPRARLRAAGAALARTEGFHLEGTTTDGDGRAEITGDIRQDGSLSIELRQQGQTITLRSAGGTTYFRADRRFWEKNGGGAQAANLLAGKWVTGIDQEVDPVEFKRYTPRELGLCLTRGVGTLSDGGTGSVQGSRVTIVKDAGDEPGTAPGSISIQAEGEPLPLRLRQTGAETPGGTRDARCDPVQADSTTAEDVTLSDFGAMSPIEAPRGAVDLKRLRQGGTGTSTGEVS